MKIMKLTRSIWTASDRIILPGVVSEVVRPSIPAPDIYVVATRVSNICVSDRILGLGLSRTPHHISNPKKHLVFCHAPLGEPITQPFPLTGLDDPPAWNWTRAFCCFL